MSNEYRLRMLTVGVSSEPSKLGVSSVIWSALRAAVVKMLSSLRVLSDNDGTNVSCDCDLAAEGRTMSTARITLMIRIRTVMSHRITGGGAGLDTGAVDFDRDTRLQQVDGD